MVMDGFATNFCSKGVLWLALRGHPLPLICAVAIAIFRYTINRRYIYDVTSPTTTFDHRQTTDTQALYQRFSTYLTLLVRRRLLHIPLNYLDYLLQTSDDSVKVGIITTVQTSFPASISHHPPLIYESMNDWFYITSQPPWIRESQSRITGTSLLSAPSRVYHLATVSTNFIGLCSVRSEQPFHRQTRETAWKAKEREGIWRYITKVNFCWPIIFLECLIST